MSTFHVDYRYELLDRSDRSLGDLVGVVKGSGKHSESAASSVHTTAEITVRDTGQVEHWTNVRVKPWVSVNGVEWPIGVFLPSVSEWAHDEYGRKVATVTLADKTKVLQQDYFGLGAAGVSSGANVVDAVEQIIASTGESNVALTPSDAVLEASVEWEPDKNKLTCTNVLLDAANMFSLYCDGHGQYQVTPYRSPASRGVRWHLVDGVDGIRLADHGIYRPTFTTAQDLGRVANVYQAIGATDGDTPALFAEAENDDPNDPLSTVNRGRVLPDGGPEMDVPNSGQASLDAYVARQLLDQSEPALVIEIEVPPMRVRFNDVVSFASDKHSISGTFVVSNVDAAHAYNATWSLKLRQVTT